MPSDIDQFELMCTLALVGCKDSDSQSLCFACADYLRQAPLRQPEPEEPRHALTAGA